MHPFIAIVLLTMQTPADTVRLTLDEAVRRAVDSGEELRRARATLRDANGQVREAFAGALPQVTGSVVYTRQFASIFEGASNDTTLGPIFANSPFGAANLWNVELRATQTLFAGGKVGAGVSAARSFRQGAAADLEEATADVVFRVKRAYLEAAYAGRLRDIAVANLRQARDHLSQVQHFRQVGTRAEYDLLRAEVDAANQEPAVVAAENGHTLALLELKRLINLPADQPVTLATALESADGSIPVVAEDSLAAVPPARPVLTAADAAVAVREQALRIARADRWPTLSVGTTLSHQAFPQEVTPFNAQFHRNWNAELRLSFPVFLGLRTVGSLERAHAALDQARAQRDQTRELVALDVTQARAELARTQALLAARRGTVRQAQRAQHLAGVRYANGMATQLEVADARVLAQQAEVNQVQATRDYLLALAQLERALGRPAPVRYSTAKDLQP
jgi:outer membrane protein